MKEVSSNYGNSRTTIEPQELRLITDWPSGGRLITYLIDDSDLCVNVTAGEKADGEPRLYDAQQGMTLVVLGVDGEHDQVHVQSNRNSMAEVLQQTLEAVQRSLDALRSVADAGSAQGWLTSVARAVEEHVKRAGRTEFELVDATGIPERTFNARMDGHLPFTIPELEAIAGFLGVTVSEILRTAEGYEGD